MHTAAPRNRRFAARWLRDLRQVGRWTRADPAPILAGDHLLVPAGTATDHFAVHDVAGTDHRGVVARLRLPAAPPAGH